MLIAVPPSRFGTLNRCKLAVRSLCRTAYVQQAAGGGAAWLLECVDIDPRRTSRID